MALGICRDTTTVCPKSVSCERQVKKRAPTAAAIEALSLVSRRAGYFASAFLRTSYSLRPPLRKSIYLLISVSWAYDALSGLPAGSMAM